MQLIFDSDKHEYTLQNFLQATNDFENTLIFAKTNHGKIIGGFMTQKWERSGEVRVRKGQSFVFYFDNDELKICWGSERGWIFCDAEWPINFFWGFSLSPF